MGRPRDQYVEEDSFRRISTFQHDRRGTRRKATAAIGEDAVIRLGEHFFSDYLLPFELASVLLLMAMIGAIVLARRDVLATDIGTGESVDQGLIEKARTPLLMEKP